MVGSSRNGRNRQEQVTTRVPRVKFPRSRRTRADGWDRWGAVGAESGVTIAIGADGWNARRGNPRTSGTPCRVARRRLRAVARTPPFLTIPPNPIRMSSPHDALARLGLSLPAAPKPVAAYVPAVRSGNLIFVSGQLPMSSGQLLATGPVPSKVSVEEAQAAAKQCALNGLAVVADQLGGDLGRVRRIVRLGVFVQSDDRFDGQPKVANGASELMLEVFGEAGRHARAAVGTNALPLDASVEVEMLVEV